MDDARWEALFYDWHNNHRLRDQQADIQYWLRATEQDSRLLVLGAGTGRVAVPLAEVGHRTVVAVDVSLARLLRVSHRANLRIICADMRQLPLLQGFDSVVIPYSTLQLLVTPQDRQRVLEEAARVVVPRGHVRIDVSASFEARTETGWHVVLSAACPTVGSQVQEWERSSPSWDHVRIEKAFYTGGSVLIKVVEQWAYLSTLNLENALHLAGFDVIRVNHGYSPDTSPHRVIYEACRRSE